MRVEKTCDVRTVTASPAANVRAKKASSIGVWRAFGGVAAAKLYMYRKA